MNKLFARKVVALGCIVAACVCYRLDAGSVKIKNETLGTIDVHVGFGTSGNRYGRDKTISSGKYVVTGEALSTFRSLSWKQEGSEAKWTADIKKKTVVRAFITIYENGYYRQGLGKKRRARSDQGGPGYFDPILKRKK